MTELHAVPDYQPTRQDKRLEREMADILDLMREAKTRAALRRLWERYRVLHAQRSLGMVANMEKKQGLR